MLQRKRILEISHFRIRENVSLRLLCLYDTVCCWVWTVKREVDPISTDRNCPLSKPLSLDAFPLLGLRVEMLNFEHGARQIIIC